MKSNPFAPPKVWIVMKQFSNEIAQPEQMSVNDLRQRLSRFGEQNKAHFEQNQVQKGTRTSQERLSGDIPYRMQHRIQQQQLEAGLASSSHSTVSTENLTVSSNDNDSQSYDGTMDEIFAEERRHVDIDDKQIEQARAFSDDKSTGTNRASKQTMMLSSSLPEKQSSTAESSVTKVVRQFGGRAEKRSVVQRSREALQRKWAEEKQPTHSKKVQWQVCNGRYQKKVTLKTHK